MCGAGRVGIGQDSTHAAASRSPSAATSSRSRSGLETTLKRPIINTRDEPHAVADLYRRLHVIIGDANHVRRGQPAQARHHLAGAGDDRGPGHLPRTWPSARPVATLHAVSHDPTLQEPHRAARRRARMTAVQLLWVYHEHADRYLQDAVRRRARRRHRRGHAAGGPTCSTRLERDPMECAREVDWVAKLQLLQGYRDRDGLEWSDHRLRAIDIQWSDVRPEKGLVPPAARPRPVRASWSATRRSRAPCVDAAGGHPGVLPRASAWRSTPTRSPPPPGTR